MSQKLLIIDDEENMRHMLSVMTSRAGYDVSMVDDAVKGLEAIKKEKFDYILCDLKMPNMDGLQFLQNLQKLDVDTIVIIMSAYGTIESAVEAMNYGALDFITKPFKSGEVLLALQKANERLELRRENEILKLQIMKLKGNSGFGAIIAESKQMLELIDLARKISTYESTVLVTGESGTGKELFARGIQQSGSRHDKPFVAVNCGSFPAELLESEFFGYVKGAFTGADADRKGLFEEADGGTLFLDEIGELPHVLQVKFLRVLQEGEVRPVGALRSTKVDVRIIAATARDLDSAVNEGAFRKDLFYRLNVVAFHLPALRERKEDIPILSEQFLKTTNEKNGLAVEEISRNAMQLLMSYHWPGNVRELKNSIERAAIFSDGNVLGMKDFSFYAQKNEDDDELVQLLGTLSLKKARKILEGRLIASALQLVGGNKSKASEMLEISYPSLLSKIKEYSKD